MYCLRTFIQNCDALLGLDAKSHVHDSFFFFVKTMGVFFHLVHPESNL